MPRVRPILLLAVAWLLPAHAADREQVRAAFTAYKQAVLSADGVLAAETLTAETFTYYEDTRDLALYGTEEELKALSVVDLMQAMTLRHRVPPEELRGLSGRQLVVLAVNRGWTGRESAARVDVGEVTVDGDSATAVIVNRGRPSQQSFSFRREGGEWKFDLVKLVEVTGAALEGMAKGQEIDAHEFVVLMLEQTSGTPVPPDIWNPPLQRPAGAD